MAEDSQRKSPQIPAAALTRAQLEAGPRQSLHEARNATKADVYLVEWPPGSGTQVVVKDLRRRALFFRVLLGRALQRREWRALQALGGIPGIPALLAVPDADAMVMERCGGRALMDFRRGEVPAEAFPRLEAILAAAHARGVTHGDLHRDNILLDADGNVAVIDWTTACVFGARRGALKNLTWREWQALDQRALAKVKARYAPQLLTEREVWLLENGGSPLYRFVRQTGFRLRRLLGHRKCRDSKSAGERYTRMIHWETAPAGKGGAAPPGEGEPRP